uniref:Uncharacterized protein n=1 Tax=Serratia phage Kevin TaxID=3161161 RepID=A0AAU8KZY4_9CAUD
MLIETKELHMNAVEQNVLITKHQGFIKAKDLKVVYLKNGTILQRRDVVIRWSRGYWHVHDVVEKVVSPSSRSKHRLLMDALKSVH